MHVDDTVNRREFLDQLGRNAAIGGLGVLTAESAQALPRAKARADSPVTGGVPGPDAVLGIGIIGVGGMGNGHLGDLLNREHNGQKLQVRAVSEVYTRRRNAAMARVHAETGRHIEGYNDYRDLLSRDDIDGVIIATPDHWHGKHAIDALEAGKDVYLQMPFTHTIAEGIAVRDAVARTGRVLQCGAQRASDDFYWQARAFIQRGGIGRVVWVQADYSRNSKGGPNDRGGAWNSHIDVDATDDPRAGAGYIDWPRWLGPAKKRPFSAPRYFQFRKYWDYSGGIATNLLYHYVAPLTLALDVGAPERVAAGGGIWIQKDDREVPDTFMMTCDYPEDLTLILTSSMANAQSNPLMIRGHRGTIYRHESGGMLVKAEPEFARWFREEHGAEEIILQPEPREDHMSNWLRCMRTREEPHLGADPALRALIAIRLGVDAYRGDQVMFWDNAAEKQVKKHPRPRRHRG